MRLKNIDVERLLEIDYDGKLIDFIIKSESGAINPSTFSLEELINFQEFVNTHTCLPYEPSKLVDNSLSVYTKEQKDTINKDSIITDLNSIITKLNDFVFVDLYDFLTGDGRTTTLNIEKGQYYIIMHPLTYNSIINAPDMGD